MCVAYFLNARGSQSPYIQPSTQSQWTKVGSALVRGGTPPDEIAGQEDPAPPKAVTPAIFKTLIGRGHPEFSTQRQQARVTGNVKEHVH